MKTLSHLALVSLAVALTVPAARPASESRIYLSWHAPYGAPGATREITVACGDTTRTDTLFLGCDVGTDSPTFDAMDATLFVHAQAGDTLGPSWQLGHRTMNPRGVRVIWESDSALNVRAPWGGVPGAGGISYDWTGGTGQLNMVFAVPERQAPPIKSGDRLVLARLVFRRPRAGPGCDQPVCIEWARSTLSLEPGRSIAVDSGDRFVTWNSPGGRACDGFSRSLRPRPWTPRGASPPR